MRVQSISALALAAGLAAASVLPAMAQDAMTPAPTDTAPVATDAPMVTTDAPVVNTEIVITPPEGYVLTEFTTVTAEELQGVDIYDAAGNSIAEIADLVISGDNGVTGIITDVGGFLGMGEHRVLLNPDQVHIYKNTDGDVRAFVMLSEEALKALPAYEAP